VFEEFKSYVASLENQQDFITQCLLNDAEELLKGTGTNLHKD